MVDPIDTGTPGPVKDDAARAFLSALGTAAALIFANLAINWVTGWESSPGGFAASLAFVALWNAHQNQRELARLRMKHEAENA